MYHGYVQSYSVGQQLKNLIEQIPQEYRARVVAIALDENPYDTVRYLTPLVMWRVWEEFDPPQKWDYTPQPNMPDINFDDVEEIPF